MAEDRPAQSWRGVDLLASLISHGSRSLAFPITVLPVPMTLSSSFALLVSAVGCAPLPPPDGFTAGYTAVPLSPVATLTNGEHGPILRRATDSHSENYYRFVDCASHSDIMPQAQR